MKNINKTSWLAEGLKIIEQEDVTRITVDNLCARLERSKGSFYFHFKNMPGYLEALMEYWKQTNTLNFIQEADSHAEIGERLTVLNELSAGASQKVERAIRGWSFSNELVEAHVREVDKLRLDYLIGLAMQNGLTQEQAHDYAVLEYAALIGIQQLWPDIPMADFKRLYGLFYGRKEA